jgi:hypothetical protein
VGAFISFAREWTDSGYFIESVDDELTWDVSYGQLDKMYSFAEQCGVNRDLWPDYIDVDGRSDSVALPDLRSKNKVLLSALLDADADRIRNFQLSSGERILNIILERLTEGDLLFISH